MARGWRSSPRTERMCGTSGPGRGPRFRAPVRLLRNAYALILLAGCGGDGPTGPAGPPTQLVKSDGDGQSWYFSNPLPAAYEVVVRDANGVPVPGVSVTWAVTAGGGTMDPTTSVTGSDGIASATHTLGPSATAHTATANAASLPEVMFSASASSPPTSAAVTVQNTDRFSPENVVVQVAGTVTWTWAPDQTQDHNVIFSGGTAGRPPNSPTQRTGTYSGAFTAPGLYQYFCNIHANMNGTVRVVN
jgi:plastocyanin